MPGLYDFGFWQVLDWRFVSHLQVFHWPGHTHPHIVPLQFLERWVQVRDHMQASNRAAYPTLTITSFEWD